MAIRITEEPLKWQGQLEETAIMSKTLERNQERKKESNLQTIKSSSIALFAFVFLVKRNKHQLSDCEDANQQCFDPETGK